MEVPGVSSRPLRSNPQILCLSTSRAPELMRVNLMSEVDQPHSENGRVNLLIQGLCLCVCAPGGAREVVLDAARLDNQCGSRCARGASERPESLELALDRASPQPVIAR